MNVFVFSILSIFIERAEKSYRWNGHLLDLLVCSTAAWRRQSTGGAKEFQGCGEKYANWPTNGQCAQKIDLSWLADEHGMKESNGQRNRASKRNHHKGRKLAANESDKLEE